MSGTPAAGPPPLPPEDFADLPLEVGTVPSGRVLHRIHRRKHDALHFGREADPVRRQRWDAPDASYGVCYLAQEDHIAFAETLLRDLDLRAVYEEDLRVRALAAVEIRRPLRLAEMHGKHLGPMRADASAVQGPYATTWAWSKALHDHPSAPDGIRYRARHDDSGLSLALFDRAADALETASTPLLDPGMAEVLGRWLDRYGVGLIG